jgi:hypothetical protein
MHRPFCTPWTAAGSPPTRYHSRSAVLRWKASSGKVPTTFKGESSASQRWFEISPRTSRATEPSGFCRYVSPFSPSPSPSPSPPPSLRCACTNTHTEQPLRAEHVQGRLIDDGLMVSCNRPAVASPWTLRPHRDGARIQRIPRICGEGETASHRLRVSVGPRLAPMAGTVLHSLCRATTWCRPREAFHVLVVVSGEWGAGSGECSSLPSRAYFSI